MEGVCACAYKCVHVCKKAFSLSQKRDSLLLLPPPLPHLCVHSQLT